MKKSNSIAYFNSFTNFELRLQHVRPQSFDLERVHFLLHALGDPQKNLRFVHVAGTKGKGSTCAFIAHILRAAGYCVGLYTSPHFYRINERIRILAPSDENIQKDFCGSISDKEFSALVKKFKPSIDRAHNDKKWGGLTYFEVMTGLALCHFARKKTDIVVLETGLGGRLDATNAVDALIDVITPISFDHTQLLGETLEKIAGEKAAIIKNSRSKVVVAPQSRRVMRVIQKRCRDLDIRPVVVGKDLKCVAVKNDGIKQAFHVKSRWRDYKNFTMGFAGKHQLENAATAVGVVKLLAEFGFKIVPKAVARGIRETRWPGRFEIVHKKPTVVVDCAHNPASVEVLVRTFRQSFPGKKAVLILGISSDKDIAGIGRVLMKIAHLVILTRSQHPRAFDFKASDLKKLFNNKPTFSCASVKEAIVLALRHASRRDVILAAGSVFVAAEVRASFKHGSA